VIPGEDVRVDVAGRVTEIGPGRLVIEAGEGGAVWSVSGLVWDIPTGATIERRET
jgi:hypothetical protein